MNHEDKSREELFADPEELVTFAQAYYATEFPDDEQHDCPPVEVLRKAAHSGTPPDERLRSHLFICSDCFRSYRSARMNRHAQPAPAGWWRDRLGAKLVNLRSPWAPVVAGAFSLILLGLLTTALLRNARTESPAVAVNYPPQVILPAAQTAASDTGSAPGEPEQRSSRLGSDRQVLKPVPRGIRAVPRNTRQQQPALRVVYIDLKEENLLRGDNESGGGRRVITLTPERQRLRLRLPRGSAPGRYTVKVVDAYGKPLLTTAAKTGGRTLTVDLDLRGLAAKLYRLCLSRDGEAPDCYLVSVGGNPSAP